jgi:hypothetical protein
VTASPPSGVAATTLFAAASGGWVATDAGALETALPPPAAVAEGLLGTALALDDGTLGALGLALAAGADASRAQLALSAAAAAAAAATAPAALAATLLAARVPAWIAPLRAIVEGLEADTIAAGQAIPLSAVSE